MSDIATSKIRSESPLNDASHSYGPRCAGPLGSLSLMLRTHAADIVSRYFEGLGQLSGVKVILDTLSEEEMEKIRLRQLEYLYALAAPDLHPDQHRTMALERGRCRVIAGMDQEELVHAGALLSSATLDFVDSVQHGEALAALGVRFARDLAWRCEAYRKVKASRSDVLQQVSQLAWEAHSYTDLIGRLVGILGNREEIAGCSVGRPDEHGVFRFESVSGKTIERYLAELEGSADCPIMAGNRTQGQGPTGRAWRSGQVERCVNIATDVRMVPWRAIAMREGFRSSVAIPLSHRGAFPRAILTLYSAQPGGYSSADQIGFIAQLQTLLGLAIARLENEEGRTSTVPYAMRQRWAALIRSDALEMHYQPMLDLKSGQIVKVEALARLRDGDRLLAPGEFFIALAPDDFFELYARGLRQALLQRDCWSQCGIDLTVSVNLPGSALEDVRYFDATRAALAEHACPAGRLTLEILETDELLPGVDLAGQLARYKSLGVRLAEDDIGSGHSSLLRLRELPFDSIKIDRNIVKLAGQDASNVLRFIYQLTRLGHSLGKRVVVEGVEHTDLLEAIVVLGADVVQGYAVARPMPAAELTRWIATGSYPALPDRLCPQRGLGRLARLLIWEERLYLASEDPPTLSTLTDIGGPAGCTSDGCAYSVRPDPDAQGCQLRKFFVEMDSVFPSGVVDREALHDVVMAASATGPRSAQYAAARQRLVAIILTEPE